jgi:hypothetical protein
LEAYQGKQHSTTSSQDINSKKGNTTRMLIATPDEILQKGLEMGGFNHWGLNPAQSDG